MEFPYWQQLDESVEPLTIGYCVDNQDGTRTQLNRINLGRALMRLVENEDAAAHASTAQRIVVVVSELRNLANWLENAGKTAPPQTSS